MRHLETLHVLGPTQNCRAELSHPWSLWAILTSHGIGDPLVASFSTASWDRWDRLVTDDLRCLCQAGMPVVCWGRPGQFTTLISSQSNNCQVTLYFQVEATRSHCCHVAIFLCPQREQCQEQRNLVIGLLRLCQILKHTYCRMHFYIFFFLEASFRVWKLWKQCGGLPDSTEEVGSKTSGLLKVSRSRQRTATDQRSVILWRTASHPIAPQWASLFSETFTCLLETSIQHEQTLIINVIQRPGVHEYPNHASSVSSLVHKIVKVPNIFEHGRK